MAGQHERNRAGELASFEARKAEHIALLRPDKSPDAFWSLIVVLSFFGWIGAAFGFIYRAWDATGGFHGLAALRWGIGVVGCFALWILSLGLA